jgi:hypothetical protein
MPTAPIPVGGSKKKKAPKGKKATEKQKFIWAEEQQESSHNYKAVNPDSGALGIAQVMPANLPGWAKECGLPQISPQGFLDDPSYQNKMVWCILGGYYDTYGAAGAASMWYSGQPNPNEKYGQPSVRDYVNDVLAIWRNAPDVLPAGESVTEVIPGVGVINALPAVPKPGSQNWSGSVTRTSEAFRKGSAGLASHSKTVQSFSVRR